MSERDEHDTSDERGRAESAADRANNPGPPSNEHADPAGASARGINPVQHSERSGGINPVQHSERGINPVQHSERAASGDGDDDPGRSGEGTGSRAGEYS